MYKPFGFGAKQGSNCPLSPQVDLSLFDKSAYGGLVAEQRQDVNCYRLGVTSFVTGDMSVSAIRCDESVSFRGGRGRYAKTRSEQTEASIASAACRAKKRIKENALQMRADRMLTLTFRENVTANTIKQISRQRPKNQKQSNENVKRSRYFMLNNRMHISRLIQTERRLIQ